MKVRQDGLIGFTNYWNRQNQMVASLVFDNLFLYTVLFDDLQNLTILYV
ncbi:hypothetical protein VDT1_1046 [Vibrio sp. 16]|nr:hypothetical protein VDT1_1046 [Vibrio sp. 16]